MSKKKKTTKKKIILPDNQNSLAHQLKTNKKKSWKTDSFKITCIGWGLSILSILTSASITFYIKDGNDKRVEESKRTEQILQDQNKKEDQKNSPLRYSLDTNFQSTQKIGNSQNKASFVISYDGLKIALNNNNGGFLNNIFITSEFKDSNSSLITEGKSRASIIDYSFNYNTIQNTKGYDKYVGHYFMSTSGYNQFIEDALNKQKTNLQNYLGLVYTPIDSSTSFGEDLKLYIFNMESQAFAYKKEIYIHHLIIQGYNQDYQVLTVLYRIGYNEQDSNTKLGKDTPDNFKLIDPDTSDELISFQGIDIYDQEKWLRQLKALHINESDFLNKKEDAITSYKNTIKFLNDNKLNRQ